MQQNKFSSKGSNLKCLLFYLLIALLCTVGCAKNVKFGDVPEMRPTGHNLNRYDQINGIAYCSANISQEAKDRLKHSGMFFDVLNYADGAMGPNDVFISLKSSQTLGAHDPGSSFNTLSFLWAFSGFMGAMYGSLFYVSDGFSDKDVPFKDILLIATPISIGGLLVAKALSPFKFIYHTSPDPWITYFNLSVYSAEGKVIYRHTLQQQIYFKYQEDVNFFDQHLFDPIVPHSQKVASVNLVDHLIDDPSAHDAIRAAQMFLVNADKDALARKFITEVNNDNSAVVEVNALYQMTHDKQEEMISAKKQSQEQLDALLYGIMQTAADQYSQQNKKSSSSDAPLLSAFLNSGKYAELEKEGFVATGTEFDDYLAASFRLSRALTKANESISESVVYLAVILENADQIGKVDIKELVDKSKIQKFGRDIKDVASALSKNPGAIHAAVQAGMVSTIRIGEIKRTFQDAANSTQDVIQQAPKVVSELAALIPKVPKSLEKNPLKIAMVSAALSQNIEELNNIRKQAPEFVSNVKLAIAVLAKISD